MGRGAWIVGRGQDAVKAAQPSLRAGGYGQETLPNTLPDGGGLLTDYYRRATVGRPCPTR